MNPIDYTELQGITPTASYILNKPYYAGTNRRLIDTANQMNEYSPINYGKVQSLADGLKLGQFIQPQDTGVDNGLTNTMRRQGLQQKEINYNTLANLINENGQTYSQDLNSGVYQNKQPLNINPVDGYKRVLTKKDDIIKSAFSAGKELGLSNTQTLAIIGEIGRENDFNPATVFGMHSDPARDKSGKTIKNLGMWSFNGDRRTDLIKFMSARNLLNSDGTLSATPEGIKAQMEYIVNFEMKGKFKDNKWARYFLNNPNLSPKEYEQALAKIIGHAYKQKTIRGPNGTRIPFDSEKHIRRKDNHIAYAQKLLFS